MDGHTYISFLQREGILWTNNKYRYQIIQKS